MFIGAQLSPETSPLNLNPSDAWMFIVLGWIPFAFCVLFFGIPLMRWLNLGFLRRKRRMANIRKRVMRAIYQSDKEIISLKELRNVINQANIEKLSEDDVTRAMNEMIVDFYGDIDFDKDGQVIYKFTRLREEQREIRQLRGEQNTDMGKIVFQSE
jgi:hypothetical protein